MHFFLVNYNKTWKCAATLKPDGTNSQPDSSVQQQTQGGTVEAAGNQQLSTTTKYYKRGIISHPNQVPWH